MQKTRPADEGVDIAAIDWQEFPSSYHTGGLQWKLLHIAPEAPAWTVLFRAVKDVTARPHVHHGPAFVHQYAGEVEIHGNTAVAPAFGYEGAGADHPATFFKKGAEFLMVMFGPLDFYDEQGQHVVMTWQDAQRIWQEQASEASAA